MAQNPTIYEIASKAKVSAATVSRVINNYPYVNKDTRAKVLKTIAEMNYIQNDLARGLATNSSMMVGILIADIRTTHHTDGVYYIEHEFSKNGYSCLIYNAGTDPEQQAKHLQLLSQKNVDAVVLIGSVFQNATVQNAIMVYLPDTPVAICNGYLDGPNIYGVTSDEYGGVLNAVKVLVSKGRRNIFFVTNKLTPSNNEKLRGFLDGIKLYSKKESKNYIEIQSSEIAAYEEATRQVLKANPTVDALIYSEDVIALAGLHVLYEQDVKIPEQVAVVGINNSRYASISNPSLTSIDNMLYDTSLIAVRNLIEVLKGEHVNHRMSIGTTLVERKST